MLYSGRFRAVIFAWILSVACSMTAGAQENSESSSSGEWSFELAPYVWLSGVEVDAVIGSNAGSMDQDFGDILEDLEGGLMLAFEGRKDRWGFFTDTIFTALEDTQVVSGTSVTTDSDQLLLKVGATYRIGNPDRYFDLMAGGRYVHLRVKLVAAGVGSADESKNWAEPFFGGRFRKHFGEKRKWTVSAAADIGGFGVGSDLTIDTNIHLRRRLSEHTTLGVGYRFIDIDYDHGSFEYDQQMHGPVLGLAFNF